MRCGSAQKLIVAAVDGEITPERRRDLDEHVAACTDCLSELRATESLLGSDDGLMLLRSMVESGLQSRMASPIQVEAAA